MILKFRFGDSWRIIDNITEADLLPPVERTQPDGTTLMDNGVIRYSRNGEYSTQPLNGTAFLLNDNGKTIERLDNPAIHMVPCL